MHPLVAAIIASPSAAWADDDAGAEPERRGFSFDLRLGGGGAAAAFTENDRPVVDFESFALGGSARFGWFLGPHVLLGAELTASWHSSVGALRVHDPVYFSSQGQPSGAAYTAIIPLGMFVEVYPWRDAGWFAAVAGGVGWLDLPTFSFDDINIYTAGYSLDVGYQFGGSGKRGPAVFGRYSRWGGEEIFSEPSDGLVSRELLVGLRWSFWTPEWQ
ncbi:MAG TPA: hypothetical protein VMG12_15950 [Polyangiaceae bacterium]|nr:hypothetical protein [Polyangiaceae bacterium]